MRKFAILNANTVTAIKDLDDNGVIDELKNNEMIFDIQDLIVTPQVGWVLVGNKLNPGPGQILDMKAQVEAKIKYYQTLANQLLISLYATNTLNGLTTAQSDMMFTNCAPVLLRIREGAWPTAIYHLQNMTATESITQPMINSWIALITANL